MRYKPYPKYKDSGVEWLGDVPENWKQSYLKHVSNINMGQSPSSKNYNVEGLGIEFLQGNADFGIINPTARTFTTEIKKVANINDILFTVRAPVGAMNIANKKYAIGRGLCAISSNEKSKNSFLWWLMPVVTIELNMVATGSTYESVTIEQVNNLQLELPPLKEQTQIATYLTQKTKKIDTLIEKQQTLIKLLKEKRQALVDKALNEDDIKSIRIDKVINKIYRPVYRDKNKTYTTLGLYNRGRGLFHREPKVEDELGESDFYWVEDGDLILSGQFAWEGAIALAKKDENITIVSHRFPIVRGKKNILNTEYLWAFFTTQLGNFILNEHSVGSAGRNRPLNMNTLVKEKIPLPSMEAQMKVAKVVQIEQLLHVKINKEIALLKERRVALVSAVVGGKVDVREWEVN